MSNVMPSDGDKLSNAEPLLAVEPERPRGFDFSKIQRGTGTTTCFDIP
jgi:hypothetical protein